MKQRANQAVTDAKFSVVEKKLSTAEKIPRSREYFLYDDEDKLIWRFVEDPRKQPKTKDWSRLMDQTTGQVALKWKDYSPATFGVLLHLMSKVRWGNYVPVAQSSIAEGLGMSVSSVSKSLAVLIKDRVLLAVDDPSIPRGKAFKLNANFMYKGRSAMWGLSKRNDGGIA